MSKRLAFLSMVVGLAGLLPAVAAGQPVPIKLDPPGPPAPTMKTLDEIPPTWNRVLTSDRFELAMDDEAVLDKETGLVWERVPSSVGVNWDVANNLCSLLIKGNRMGWRLPSIHELTSLLDPSMPGPSLPVDHPFSLTSEVRSLGQWSATSTTDSAFVDTVAWATLHQGSCPGSCPLARTILVFHLKSALHTPWCVRGPSGAGGR